MTDDRMSRIEQNIDWVTLRKQLGEALGLGELKDLCFDLGVDYESLPAHGKAGKARELILHFQRRGRVPELIQRCTELRSDVPWAQSPVIEDSEDSPDVAPTDLHRFYQLVRAFNQSRRLPFSHHRTSQGDGIAHSMLEIAPLVCGQFDVENWLNSTNPGKRLAAIKYLGWLQDIEFLENLSNKLTSEKPFLQFHTLLTLDSMVDQLDVDRRNALRDALGKCDYSRDSSREYWKNRLVGRLSAGE